MAKSWTKAKTEAIATTEEKKKVEIPQAGFKEPAPIEGVGNVWYDPNTGKFFRETEDKTWIDYRDPDFRRYLKYCHFTTKIFEGQTISPLEKLQVEVHQHRRVAFAGEIAGYPAGLHRMSNDWVLIPKGLRLMKPKRGSWATIKTLVNEALGMQQRYFYGWLKSAMETLTYGAPFRAGQMLAMAGPSGAGKSLIQNLLTAIFGGRCCKPYDFLVGVDRFNSTLLGAEHWMIEDDASSTDIRARRHFAAKIKNTVVNMVHDYKPKHRDHISVCPFIRLTMTLNSNPESMLVLPPLDEDVEDKIMLLKATKIVPRFKEDDIAGRVAFSEKMNAEIPALLYQLQKTPIPKDLRDHRYGVKTYHHPGLKNALQKLSPEERLLNIIDGCDFFDGFTTRREGTAFEIEKELKNHDKNGDAQKLFSFNTACGTYLARLATNRPERVTILSERKGQNIYLIVQEKKGA